MLKPIRSEVFGSLVPDQWKMDLLAFRQFPAFKEFWPEGRDELLADLNTTQRECVAGWKSHQPRLASICRDAEVHLALQAHGVYEVTVEVAETSPRPSESQEAAYRLFLENEEQYCHNVKAALLRYYRFVSVECDDWFLDDEWPKGHSLSDLRQLIEFDGIRVNRCSSHGVSLVTFAWNPAWDPEHGMVMATWQGEVLLISSELGGMEHFPDEAHDDEIWDKSQLTSAELEALEGYIEGFQPSDRGF